MASRLQDVVLRGTRAAQPAIATVAPGTLYFVTDEGVTERAADDNSAWQTYSGAGGALTSFNVSAGTLSQALTNLVFSNSNGITFGLSASTITGSVVAGLSNVNISAGTTSNNLSNFVFSNSNNLSFGLNGSTITGTVTVASTQGSINLSAGTTSNLSSNFIFSNSNNVSFGINGNTLTATATFPGGGSINISAGTTSNNLATLVFSNSNGISFGLNGSTVTASGGAGGAGGTISYFENMPRVTNVGNFTTTVSVMLVEPVVLPAALQANIMRVMVTNSITNYTVANTTANTTFTGSQGWTFGVQYFSKLTGASSLSFSNVSTFTIGMTQQTIVGAGAVGSQYTVTYNMTYPSFGNTITFSNSYAITSASYVFSSSPFTAFSANRWFDVSCGTITQGNYWFGLAVSSTSSNNGGPAGLTKGYHFSWQGNGQSNDNPRYMGSTSALQWQFGQGFFQSAGGQMLSSSAYDISQVSTHDQQRRLYFQLLSL